MCIHTNVCSDIYYAHTHTHTHTYVHTYKHMHTHTCVCVRACVRVCVCVGREGRDPAGRFPAEDGQYDGKQDADKEDEDLRVPPHSRGHGG